jgi:transposase
MINQFYENLLGLDKNWKVKGVEQNNGDRTVTIAVAYAGKSYRCPECGADAALHDFRKRTVRHLDSCEYRTYLDISYPRARCEKCGTQAITPPFAAANSRFTNAFENRVIELCMKAPVQKVAHDMGLNWHVVEGIKDRAFKRGSARRLKRPLPKVRHLAVDETSFQKHHNYSTIVSDADNGTVLASLDGRDADGLINFFQTQRVADFSGLESISMDMAPPFIKAVRESFANADALICYDRFHVAQLFSRAVDNVRKRESAAFNRGGKGNPLIKTKFEWLRNNGKADNRKRKRRKFIPLTDLPLQTAKAWRLKERAARLWDYLREGNAAKAWKNLLWRLSHSRIGELKRLAASVKEHLKGILNAIKLRVSNAAAEARNSCIQRVKYMACGYRDKARFNREILFQFGGLDLAF